MLCNAGEKTLTRNSPHSVRSVCPYRGEGVSGAAETGIWPRAGAVLRGVLGASLFLGLDFARDFRGGI